MKLNHIHTFSIFILIFFFSCSDSNDNDENVNDIIPKTYISKVTITEGPLYYHSPNSITSYQLNYDSNKNLISIDIENSRDKDGFTETFNATYTMIYDNEQIVKAYTDCATDDCEWDSLSNTDGLHQISFDYGLENGFKSVIAYEQVQNISGEITYSYEIGRYLLNSNNLVKRVEDNTEIIYSNNNIVGIQNSSSFNDRLQYLDYDDKKSVVIFTDDTHVMDIGDYFVRLILDLKYSKNNYRQLDFFFRGQHQIIDLKYDDNNRPTKRTVFNYDILKYEETFEYLE